MQIRYKLDPTVHDLDGLKKAITVPQFVHVQSFTPDAAKTFEKEVADAVATGQPIVPVVIDSYGGQVYALLSMLDTIRACPIPVATIVQGKAMSCGAILFAAGADGKRFMSQNSTLVIHEVSTGDSDKVSEVKATVAEAERLNDIIFAVLDDAARVPRGTFQKKVHDNGHADIYLDAKQAKALGLANAIKLPSWTVQVGVKLSLA